MQYLVFTPHYQHDDEWRSDVTEVDAENKRQAKLRGVTALYKSGSPWVVDRAQQSDKPMKGILTEKIPMEPTK